jgi:hypothetical protein
MIKILNVDVIKHFLLPGINFIRMIMHGFFARKTKKLLIFSNEFHHDFLYENCAGCVICKSHLAVPVAIRKSQLALHNKALKKPCIKMLMKLTPDFCVKG